MGYVYCMPSIDHFILEYVESENVDLLRPSYVFNFMSCVLISCHVCSPSQLKLFCPRLNSSLRIEEFFLKCLDLCQRSEMKR